MGGFNSSSYFQLQEFLLLDSGQSPKSCSNYKKYHRHLCSIVFSALWQDPCIYSAFSILWSAALAKSIRLPIIFFLLINNGSDLCISKYKNILCISFSRTFCRVWYSRGVFFSNIWGYKSRSNFIPVTKKQTNVLLKKNTTYTYFWYCKFSFYLSHKQENVG